MTFDDKINRPARREAKQPKTKRGPYKCQGLTRDKKAYAAAYYRQRLEKGLCSKCGRKNDRPGKVMCSACCQKPNN